MVGTSVLLRINGVMATGCPTGGAWYYLDPPARCTPAGFQMGSRTVHDERQRRHDDRMGADQAPGTTASGQTATGWQQIGGTWYYFGTGGDMYTGGHWIGWRWYTFGSDGRWLG